MTANRAVYPENALPVIFVHVLALMEYCEKLFRRRAVMATVFKLGDDRQLLPERFPGYHYSWGRRSRKLVPSRVAR